MSLPAGGAWIEMPVYSANASNISSLPAGGAWIEIYLVNNLGVYYTVAPRRGSVD